MPKGSKGIIEKHLSEMKISDMDALQERPQYDHYAYREFESLHKKLVLMQAANPNSKFRTESFGTAWGYPAKAVNVFLWDVCLNRLLVSECTFKRLLPFLHCPLDRKILIELKSIVSEIELQSIRSITFRKYKKLQDHLHSAAVRKGLHRIQFDDYAFTKGIS